jgi:hypothetical protein
MRSLVSKVSCLIVVLSLVLSGCTSTELKYVSEDENQLTKKEIGLLVKRAKLFLEKNSKSLRIEKKDIDEIVVTYPEVRSYCDYYKYGRLSFTWQLKSNNIVMVKANGKLLSLATPLSVKVIRVLESRAVKKDPNDLDSSVN